MSDAGARRYAGISIQWPMPASNPSITRKKPSRHENAAGTSTSGIPSERSPVPTSAE